VAALKFKAAELYNYILIQSSTKIQVIKKWRETESGKRQRSEVRKREERIAQRW
jgi:hypothetical protein